MGTSGTCHCLNRYDKDREFTMGNGAYSFKKVV